MMKKSIMHVSVGAPRYAVLRMRRRMRWKRNCEVDAASTDLFCVVFSLDWNPRSLLCMRESREGEEKVLKMHARFWYVFFARSASSRRRRRRRFSFFLVNLYLLRSSSIRKMLLILLLWKRNAEVSWRAALRLWFIVKVKILPGTVCLGSLDRYWRFLKVWCVEVEGNACFYWEIETGGRCTFNGCKSSYPNPEWNGSEEAYIFETGLLDPKQKLVTSFIMNIDEISPRSIEDYFGAEGRIWNTKMRNSVSENSFQNRSVYRARKSGI